MQRVAAAGDFYLQAYDCAKSFAWRADAAVACSKLMPYPRGNLQVWHLTEEGFAETSDAHHVLGLVASAVASPPGLAAVKQEVKQEVKSEPQVKAEPSTKPSGRRASSGAAGGRKRIKVEKGM